MKTLLWIVTIAGSIFGGLILALGLLFANGAPQQAAVAGISISLAVIPYCLARAVSEIGK